MLAFYLAVSIISIIAGIVSVIAIFIARKHKPLYIGLALLFAAIPVFLLPYIYNHEAEYYEQHGNPKARYAQVKSMSQYKISVWYDQYNGQDGNFTIKDPTLLQGLHEGDVIKVAYVNGIYRAFAFDIQKYVPEK